MPCFLIRVGGFKFASFDEIRWENPTNRLTLTTQIISSSTRINGNKAAHVSQWLTLFSSSSVSSSFLPQFDYSTSRTGTKKQQPLNCEDISNNPHIQKCETKKDCPQLNCINDVQLRTHLETQTTVLNVCVCVSRGLVNMKHDTRSWLSLNCQPAPDEVCSSKGWKCVCESSIEKWRGVIFSLLEEKTSSDPDR